MNSLRAFEAAARCRSISDASEELFVTPSAVSQQIKKLEELLDLELLRREHRKVLLTDEGRRLGASLTEAFGGIRRTLHELTSADESECLEIACPPPFAAKFLATRIGGFIRNHPELDVRLVVGLEKVDYVAGNIDVGVRLSPNDEEGMINSAPVWEYRAPLATERYLAALDIQSPEDLFRATLLEKNFGNALQDTPAWREWYAAAGCTLVDKQRRVDFGPHCDLALDAALAHSGIVLGELINGSKHVIDESLLCPFGPAIPLGLAYRVVRHVSRPFTEPVALFSQWIEAELREAAKQIERVPGKHPPGTLAGVREVA